MDQALANRARADQDLVNRGRVDHQVLQEIGRKFYCNLCNWYPLIIFAHNILFAFKTLSDGSLTHPVNRARVAVVNQARAVAGSRARAVDPHLQVEIGVVGVLCKDTRE